MQATRPAKPALQARHAARIGARVVIVTHEVQEAMQRQSFELIGVRMARFAGLAARNSCGNRKIRGFEREDVGGRVLPAVLPVQRADALIRDKSYGDFGG